MNKQIALDNCERIGKGRRKVQLVSYREMGVFLGIFLVARLEGKKGSQLWVGNSDEGEGYRSQIDMSAVMKEYRHCELRNYFEIFFADHLKKGEDAWWKVMGGVDGFNQNRRQTIKASHEKTPDESMSAHRPRTTATGELLAAASLTFSKSFQHIGATSSLSLYSSLTKNVNPTQSYRSSPLTQPLISMNQVCFLTYLGLHGNRNRSAQNLR